MLNGFRVGRQLGRGAMGVVYLAQQVSLDRPIALKILDRRLAEDQDYIARFLKEAKTAARLRHPNIVQAIDAGADKGLYYFAMELVEGQSVQALLENRPHLPVPAAVTIGIQIARALDYAWRKERLVHRDVKPDNILIDRDGRARLADLGTALNVDVTVTMATAAGAIVGTPHYLSPEQIRGQSDIDQRSDIYSLGCTMFHSLTGQAPYAAEGVAAILLGHLNKPVPDPQTKVEEIPDVLAAFVMKMMAKDPADRPQDARKVQSFLEKCVGFCKAPKREESPAPPQQSPPAMRPVTDTASGNGMRTSGALRVLAVGQAPDAVRHGHRFGDRTTALLPAIEITNVSKVGETTAMAQQVLDAGPAVQRSTPSPIPGLNARSAGAPPTDVSEYQQWYVEESGLPLALELYLGHGVVLQSVLVPPGEFLMGSPADQKQHRPDEEPVHKVRITKPFYMGIYPVTRAEFAQFVAHTKYTTIAERGGRAYAFENGQWTAHRGVSWKAPLFLQAEDHPAVCISWRDAEAFCHWLSMRSDQKVRLATEAEWEYACRAGATGAFWWGSREEDVAQYANVGDIALLRSVLRKSTSEIRTLVQRDPCVAVDDGWSYTSPVGNYRPNRFGLCDMLGNVWEWCHDWYDNFYFRRSPIDDPSGPGAGSYRVLRGGAWDDVPAAVRCAVRNWNRPTHADTSYGFRIAVSAPATG